jgi:hypothetical protein
VPRRQRNGGCELRDQIEPPRSGSWVRAGQGQPAPRRMRKVPTTVRTVDRQIAAVG